MSKARILIVEDEALVARSIGNWLRKLGYGEFDIVATGEEAIAMVETMPERPDLVLMDIKLKGNLDGVETADLIYGRFNIPIVYLTAFAEDATLKRAKATGPFGYVLKPFEGRELNTAIELALYKHKLENKLKQSEQWLATTLKSIGDGLITVDMQGEITFMNAVAEQLTGWQLDESKEHPITDIFKIVEEKTKKRIADPALQAIREKKIVGLERETVLVARSGKEISIGDSAAPIVDDVGNVSGAVLVFYDNTEQRTAEILQSNLLKKVEQANQELTDFAHTVSHDLKAPLHTINLLLGSFSDRNLEKMDDEGKRELQLLSSKVEQMHQLIDSILAYSKMSHVQEKIVKVDLNDVVHEALTFIGPLQNVNVTITNKLPKIWCEKTPIHRIFQNLLGNAVKYNDKQTCEIKISCVQENEFWKFSVSDNGPGIPAHLHSKIFELFSFTTKPTRKDSTGVGLSLTRKIIERYGGAIWVESQPGIGTTFLFTLPV